MKYLVMAGLIAAAMARPASACAWASDSDSEPAVVESPPPPEPDHTGLATMLIGGLLVASVMTRWVFASVRR